MFQGSRSRLLGYYLLVMAATLTIFSGALYFLFSRSLYHDQLDTNLQTLARVAAPYYVQVRTLGQSYLDENKEFPWRDFIDEENQSLEWFDEDGRLIANQGTRLHLFFPPPENGGFLTLKGKPALDRYQIRTFTLAVSVSRSELDLQDLKGYIRSSQSTLNLQNLQEQFVLQLAISTLMALGLVGVSGVWLTRKALEPVERSFKQLKQFTADASHELRSPLTAIKSSIDVMRRHPERFQPKDVKKLAAIASATDQMTGLTQDLLFLARTEGTKEMAEGEWQLINLHHLLQDLVDWLETIAQEKEVVVTYQSKGDLELWGDRSQLSRLFSNLIENAVQYTPPQGKVTVNSSKQNQNIIISVRDTGMGIAAGDIKNVFDRFWRADQARLYRQGGTGLGLAISQAIAQRHGGHIEVTSRLGFGSCFQVHLPPNSKNPRPTSRSFSLSRLSGLLPRLRKYSATKILRRIALVALTLLLFIFPFWLVREAFRQTIIFQGVEFPNGARSFVDRVVYPSPPDNGAAAVLGVPNSAGIDVFSLLSRSSAGYTLKQGQSIVLEFTDNLLTGGGDSKPDLWVFTKGNPPASLFVEVSKDPGRDLKQWAPVGKVKPDNGGVDIDSFDWGTGDFFAYVRLTNESLDNTHLSGLPNIELEAVGAISSVNLLASSFPMDRLDDPVYWVAGLILSLFPVFYAIYILFRRLQPTAPQPKK